MRGTDILADGFARVPETVRGVLDGVTPDDLVRRLDPDANTLAWLVWHIGREQDLQVADLSGGEQVWVAGGWAERMGVDAADDDAGYGNTTAEVGRIRASAADLQGYVDAVAEEVQEYLEDLVDDDLDDVVDEAWTPPVTRGVRLVSILDDALQHAGQAAYLRGVLDRSA